MGSFLPLVFDSSYLSFKSSFPINLAFRKKKKAFEISFSVRQRQWNLRCVVIRVGEKGRHLFLLNGALFTEAIAEN